jgi:CHAT domain-containing protein/Tfp pilus assembly protein PilF
MCIRREGRKAFPVGVRSCMSHLFTKSFRWITLIMVLVSLCHLGFSQSALIQSEHELLVALTRAQQEDRASLDKILSNNKQFVTTSLWRQTMESARGKFADHATEEEALALYGIAGKIAETLNDDALLAITYYNIARSHLSINQFEEAKTAFLKSKDLFIASRRDRDLVCVLSDLGTLSWIAENYSDAKRYSEQSVQLATTPETHNAPEPSVWPDEYGVASSLLTLAEVSMREGDLSRALEHLDRSLDLFKQLNRKQSTYDFYIGEVHAALGRVYTSIGDHVQALSHLIQALASANALKEVNQVANLLNSIGFLYLEQEDYSQAKVHFEKSLQLSQREKFSKEAARALLNLGVIQQRQGNYDEAIELFKQSVNAIPEKNSDIAIAAKEGIGVALTGKGSYERALETLNEALRVAQGNSNRKRETEILWRQAETHFAMHDYEGASRLAECAMKFARELRESKLEYLSATSLGRSYSKLGKLEFATKTLLEAIYKIEQSRELVAGAPEEPSLFFEHRLSAYHELIDLYISQNRALDALLIAERAKARSLLDIVRGGKQGLSKVLTADEKLESDRLNKSLFEINEKIAKTKNALDLQLLTKELDSARLDYAAFENGLYLNHPNLRLRTEGTSVVDSNGLREFTVKENVAYLEYVLTDEKLYLFVLRRTKKELTVRVRPISDNLEDIKRLVERHHHRLASRHPDFREDGHALYSMMLAPAHDDLEGIDNICIIPDGFLWNLPFQALISEADRYVIQDFAVSYAPSLGVLREIAIRKSMVSQPSLLAFANPVVEKSAVSSQELCPLPEAEVEVQSIAGAFGLSKRKLLIGKSATEEAFKRTASAYSVIHLATHGLLDNRNPLYSHLRLTKTDGDVENDGLLEAREIMNMNLHADLAVLSACETANGRVSPGEGVIGMSWAFLAAGTRSVVVSQWKVNSASTSILMANFYRTWARKPNLVSSGKYSTALRQNALRMIKSDRYRHPFYWSGFVLIGAND